MNDKANGASGEAHPNASPSAPAQPAGRSRTRAEERIAALDAAPAAAADPAPAPVGDAMASLQAQLAAAEQTAADNASGWQRERADFLNFRRRSEEDLARAREGAGDGLIRKVLGVADDLDRAIEHIPADDASSPWVEGIAAIDRKLRLLLESQGVTPIDAVGKPFDPREHEAVTIEPSSEAADGTVLRELQRGYYLRDRVLRPALVSVATSDNAVDPSTQEGADRAQQGRE